MPHVQHDYYSTLDQSNSYFMAFSLLFLSLLLKLPNDEAMVRKTPQINDLIDSVKKSNRAARAARFSGAMF